MPAGTNYDHNEIQLAILEDTKDVSEFLEKLKDSDGFFGGILVEADIEIVREVARSLLTNALSAALRDPDMEGKNSLAAYLLDYLGHRRDLKESDNG